MGGVSRVVVIAAVAAAAAVALIVYSSLSLGRVTCEVTIEYGGGSETRRAQGSDRDEAVRTATEIACTFLSSGMTQRIACTRTPPSRVACRES